MTIRHSGITLCAREAIILPNPPQAPQFPTCRLIRRLPVLCAALALVCLSAGCLDYHEELWLYPDHSGRIECKVRVPGDVWERTGTEPYTRWRDLRGMLENLAQRVDGVRLGSFNETITRRNYRATWAFDFGSPEALTALLQEGAHLGLSLSPDPGVWGQPEVAVQVLGRLTTVKRTFPPVPPPEDTPTYTVGEEVPELRFVVHAPHSLLSAPGARFENTRRTATWTMAPSRFLREGAQFEWSYRRPFPLAPVLGGGFTFLVGIGAIWGLALHHMTREMRLQKQRQEAEAAAEAARAASERIDRSDFVDDWTEQ